jgi:chromosome partitioning protein
MPILLFLNIKGGVAKTTSVVGVSESLAALGHRVLVIDADHQCASSELLLGERRFLGLDHRQSTLHDLLASLLDPEFVPEVLPAFVAKGASNVEEVQPRLSVIPCSFRINDFATNMAKAKRGFHTNDEFQGLWNRRRGVLRTFLTQNFDYTIVDCPPSLAPQVKFLLRVADSYVIPCIPDRISLRGALYLQDRLDKDGFHKDAMGTLWTLYRKQNERHDLVVRMVAKHDGGSGRLSRLPKPFRTVIPNATAIVRALESDEKVPNLRAKYTQEFAGVFAAVAREIIARAPGPAARRSAIA